MKRDGAANDAEGKIFAGFNALYNGLAVIVIA
jgi:hypothetical protein